MSTRAHIKFIQKGFKSRYCYHHCDGNPTGVGLEVAKFLLDLNFKKYKDPDSISTYLEQWDPNYEKEDFGTHGDEEYLYTVNLDDKVLTCYKVTGNEYADYKKLDNYKICFTFTWA